MTNPTAPTRVRWIVLALTVCIAVLLYLDRFCLGYVTPYVKEGLGLSSGETGFMLGAFFYTYAIGQIPAGWMADRYGVRWMLSLYLAIWSIMTALTGFANTFLVLLLLRFGCGLFEAGCYPACAGLIRRWIPYDQRGLASGIVSLGGRIGGAITPAVTSFLIIVNMPVSKPSTVTEPDLLDVRKLARMMTEQKDEPKLPDRFAERLRMSTPPLKGSVFTTLAESANGKPTAAQVTDCTVIVNAWILNRGLFDGLDLSSIKPKLNGQGLALLDDPETSMSPQKSERLNRYILEVLFPDSIRKVLGDGWPPVLMVYGAIGVCVALIFVLFYRNTPREHFLTNEAEAQLAEANETKAANTDAPTPAGRLWRGILTDVSLWACAIMQFGTNFGWVILGNQLALYLAEVHQVPEGERGIMASLPFFVALPTLIVGGWWTDWMTKRYGPRMGRAFPIVSTRFATAAAFVVCPFLDSAWAVIIVLCVMSVVHDMGLPAIWGYNLDVGKRNVGVVLGWGNMWGNLGSAVSASVLVPLAKNHGYNALFWVCAGVFVFIGLLSFLIDASKPIGGTIVPPPPASDTGIHEGEPPVRPR